MPTATAIRMKMIQEYLGPNAEHLLTFNTPKISRERLHLPGPDVVDRLYSGSDRNNRVLVNLQRIFEQGRLGGSGYLSSRDTRSHRRYKRTII